MNKIKVWTKNYEWRIDGELTSNNGYLRGNSNEMIYYTIETDLSICELADKLIKEGYILCDGDNLIFANIIFKLSL